MAKKVLKFGGTSVGSIKRILHAAKIIKKEHNNGNKLIVVVSAMAGTTNNLVEHSNSISKQFNPDIKTIVYSQDELSDFLRPQIDFALDPQLFPPNLVAEEISNLFS